MTNNKITKELEKFVSSNDYKNYERKLISEKSLSEKTIFVKHIVKNCKDNIAKKFYNQYALNWKLRQ